jgi:CRISPR/Cas system CSM-associated protein Csm3 (group 7 of RAMP superfamily)
MTDSRNVLNRIVLKGTIELLSPALIGCGKSDRTDVDILKDNEGKPFIPASSFIGVLRHYIKLDNGHAHAMDKFWGYAEDKAGRQSSVKCSDLSCTKNTQIVVRDGIRIDNKTGIVKSGAKYDYEIIERGSEFCLYMETVCSDDDTFNRRMMATIKKILEHGNIQIGAKTNNGLGRIRLKDAGVFTFDFSQKEDVLKWLKKDFDRTDLFNETPFEIKSKTFSINAIFDLKSSFIIRSYSANPEEPDAVSIKSKDDFIITGSSLKGAIRARSEKILNTLEKPQEILFSLFGNVNKDTKERSRGRIRIDEVVLPKYIAELQTRIKIDRFTGGTIESALFETMPLFNQYNPESDNSSEKVQNVRITITDYNPYEAGLMLLVLKDLWTGDLAVGGDKAVGRGTFEGFRAEIEWNGKNVTIDKNLSVTPSEYRPELENFVKELSGYGI